MTLIVVLLILVVVTILGIGGAQIALLGERSTRYDRDYLIASQGAEAALMDAENDIDGPAAAPPTTNRIASFTPDNVAIFSTAGCGTTAATRGLCPPAPPGTQKQIWQTVNFLDSSATAPTVEFGTYTGRAYDAVGTSGIRPDRPPRYIIEMVDDRTLGVSASPAQKIYRITAIGFGPRPDIQVVMQTAYRSRR